jgi:GT2 family glycosyltransferase
MYDFAIGIPTINRYDLLEPTLESYLNLDFPNVKIYVVDNGKQNITIKHPNLTVITPSKNLGVAASWNVLCSLIFGHTNNALILNDDIYLGKTEVDIYQLLGLQAEFYAAHEGWCAFILPKTTYEKVGLFDAAFYPAYFEDNDYHRRMNIAGCGYTQTAFLRPEIFRVSMTITKDPTINKRFEINKEYFVKKWGGLPHHETYTTPFNK